MWIDMPTEERNRRGLKNACAPLPESTREKYNTYHSIASDRIQLKLGRWVPISAVLWRNSVEKVLALAIQEPALLWEKKPEKKKIGIVRFPLSPLPVPPACPGTPVRPSIAHSSPLQLKYATILLSTLGRSVTSVSTIRASMRSQATQPAGFKLRGDLNALGGEKKGTGLSCWSIPQQVTTLPKYYILAMPLKRQLRVDPERTIGALGY